MPDLMLGATGCSRNQDMFLDAPELRDRVPDDAYRQDPRSNIVLANFTLCNGIAA
jgi:hypothetical protein